MRISILVSVIMSLLTAGCNSGDFPVAAASGRVLCEGKGVPDVQVFFEPLGGAAGSVLVGKQGIATTDAEGRFEISTYGDRDGAVIGKHRVRVGPPREMTADFRCDCVLDSEVDVMQVEITEDGKNEFEVTLKKKVAGTPKTPEELEAIEEAKERASEQKTAPK